MSAVSQEKSELRKTVLTKRDALAEADRIEMSLAAAEHGLQAPQFASDVLIPGTIVSGFLPIRSEIDTRPLMAALAKRNARLCLPVVISKTEIQFRELVRGGELVDCGFGTVGPGESAAVLDPQILLVPLSAWDENGGRMGYGAGHYDRAIERLIEKGITPTLYGMAFGMQKVETVPMEAHDRILDGIINEQGFVAAQK